MTLDRDDLDADPIAQFQRWHADVIAAGLPEPTAMILVTAPAEAHAQPTGRHVLLKGADADGFTWVTNQRSRKGRQLAANPRASLVFPWFPIERQVIVTGTVAIAGDAESDAYFATRARQSQLAAWASEQSQPIPDRRWLEDRWAALAARYDGVDVPRPPWWGMYRLTPLTIELWQQQPYRMHDRFLYERADAAGGWSLTRLCP